MVVSKKRSSKNLEEKRVNFATVQVYIWFELLKIYELGKDNEEKQEKGWKRKEKEREGKQEKEGRSLYTEYTD